MKQIIIKGRLLVGVVLALVLFLVAMAAPPFPKPIAAAPDIAVTFPDANLEMVIREATGIYTGDITEADLLLLTTLDGHGKDIIDLTGLEYCVNLTVLDLHSDNISSISPILNLTGLTDLNLLNNQITSVPSLENLISLTNLDLHTNQITSIYPIQNLPDLTNLDLHNNQISATPLLQNLPSLTNLDLHTNQISNISPILNLPALNVLDLHNNQISDISPLQDLTSPAVLDLHSNQISDIQPLVDNTGLASCDIIDLTNNPLNSNSINSLIPALETRGVIVYYNTPAPDITVFPVSYDFGNVKLGRSSDIIVRISNLGGADLEVAGITFQAGSSSDYAITMAPALPAIITHAGVEDIKVTFTPSVEGSSAAVLEMTSTDPDEPSVQVTLSGTGRTEVPPYAGPLFDCQLHTRDILPDYPELLLSYLDRENVARAITFHTHPETCSSFIRSIESRVVTLFGASWMLTGPLSEPGMEEELENQMQQRLKPLGPCWGFGELGLWKPELQEVTFDSPQMQTVFQLVNDLKGIVMIHFSDNETGGRPTELIEIEPSICKYPDAIFLFHHLSTFDEVAQLMSKYPNVYYNMDFVGSFRLGQGVSLGAAGGSENATSFLAGVDQIGIPNIVERNIRDLSPLLQQYPDRIFWGTDLTAPWHFDEAVTDVAVGIISRRFIGRLPDEIQEKYAYQNAQRVFGRFFTPTEYETPTGNNIVISDSYSGVTLEFTSVDQSGITSILVSEENPGDSTTEFLFLDKYYDINTEASYSGSITITIAYDDTGMTLEEEEALRLYHWSGSVWENVTVLPVDTENNLISGEVTSLSWFAVGTGPKIIWLPPLSKETPYQAQAGRTVPIKFQLADASGSPISNASVMVTVTPVSGGEPVFSAPVDRNGNHYQVNAQTKGWESGDYTINVSVPDLCFGAKYRLSLMEKGKAKGKDK